MREERRGVPQREPWGTLPAREPVSASAYRLIRDAILHGRLAPGTRINEVELAQAWSISRTPVRDALRRLEAEGLVEAVLGRGMVVPSLGRADVDELYKMGSDQVIPEEFETSIEIFSRVLQEYHIPKNVIANQIQIVRFGGYKMLRGLSLDQENLGRIASLFAGATVDNIQLSPGDPAVGRTLRELDIRKNTGATVIAIARAGEANTNPGPDFMLQSDDIVVLIGGHKELDESMELLTRKQA